MADRSTWHCGDRVEMIEHCGDRVADDRTSLLTRFAWLSLILVVVLGVVLAAVLRTTVQERAVTDAIRTAEVAAASASSPCCSRRT